MAQCIFWLVLIIYTTKTLHLGKTHSTPHEGFIFVDLNILYMASFEYMAFLAFNLKKYCYKKNLELLYIKTILLL